MQRFAILCDGTCDLQEGFQKQYDIRVIPGQWAKGTVPMTHFEWAKGTVPHDPLHGKRAAATDVYHPINGCRPDIFFS